MHEYTVILNTSLLGVATIKYLYTMHKSLLYCDTEYKSKQS